MVTRSSFSFQSIALRWFLKSLEARLPPLPMLRLEDIDQVEAIVMGPVNEDETDL
jgi:hypothetical protein